MAFPTETVYGLGADALNEDAAAKIYAAKGRPSDNPLIVHITERKMLDAIVSEVSPQAELLMEKFWPGPMTLIFKKSDLVPYGTTGGLDTVAVRMPSIRSRGRSSMQAGAILQLPAPTLPEDQAPQRLPMWRKTSAERST